MREQLTPAEEDLAFELAIRGESITKTVQVLGFKTLYEFHQYRLKYPLFSKALRDAREASCDTLEDQALSVVEDHDSPHSARVKLDALKAVLAFKNPQRYGNKVDVTMTQTVDIGSSLNRMQERLDATYRDVTPTLIAPKPNDSNDLW